MVDVFNSFFYLSRRQKRLVQLIADSGLIIFSFSLAMLLRLDSWDFRYSQRDWLILSAVVPVSLFVFVRMGFYRAVIRYMTPKALEVIIVGVGASALSLWIVSFVFSVPVPRSIPFIYAMLAMCTIGGVRFALRGIYLSGLMRTKKRVVIYGAGSAGRQLAASLNHGVEYQPVAFVDDAAYLHNTSVQGLNVYPPKKIAVLIKNYNAEKILLAVPSASRTRRREILDSLNSLGVSVQTIPGLADIVSGKSRINEIHDVAVEDLLCRDPTPPDVSLMGAKIFNKVVMVTGAGGSIGSELCRQIIRQHPSQLLLLELSEFALYTIEQELLQLSAELGLQVDIKPILGSVQNGERLESVMKTHSVETIYHAAAYKHVPMVEYNVIEGVRNNVFGTLHTARAAIVAGVETFVLVSTDKAVRPTNVMGATKRLAELVCQALAELQSATCFSMVRFGNVLGSSGSVVPLFRRQIQAGGPITVTHPEITRYFMTIPEAAELVIQAGSMGKGGDVFVLDMGEPVKIVDLAKHMVRLSGLEPFTSGFDGSGAPSVKGGDIEIVYTGLRPGEKLYEELLIGDNVEPTRHKRIMTAREIYWPWKKLEPLLDELLDACGKCEPSTVRHLLLESPIGYRPHPQEAIAKVRKAENSRKLRPASAIPTPEIPVELA